MCVVLFFSWKQGRERARIVNVIGTEGRTIEIGRKKTELFDGSASTVARSQQPVTNVRSRYVFTTATSLNHSFYEGGLQLESCRTPWPAFTSLRFDLNCLYWKSTRREFLREILYKNIAIIAIQHSKMHFVDTFGDFSILLSEIHSSPSGKFPYTY